MYGKHILIVLIKAAITVWLKSMPSVDEVKLAKSVTSSFDTEQFSCHKITYDGDIIRRVWTMFDKNTENVDGWYRVMQYEMVLDNKNNSLVFKCLRNKRSTPKDLLDCEYTHNIKIGWVYVEHMGEIENESQEDMDELPDLDVDNISTMFKKKPVVDSWCEDIHGMWYYVNGNGTSEYSFYEPVDETKWVKAVPKYDDQNYWSEYWAVFDNKGQMISDHCFEAPLTTSMWVMILPFGWLFYSELGIRVPDTAQLGYIKPDNLYIPH